MLLACLDPLFPLIQLIQLIQLTQPKPDLLIQVCVRSFLPGDLRFVRWQQQLQQHKPVTAQGAAAAVEAAILEP